MKEQQTPTKLSAPRSAENRTARSNDFPSKKSRKISNKSVNSSSASFSEESVDLSLISEITEENLNEDVSTFLLEEPSSVTLLQPEKKTDTGENSSSNCFDVCEFDKFTSVEDDITVNFLKNFKPDEILPLDNADPPYKKLRDEIIEYVLQDLRRDALPKEEIQMQSQPQVVSRKKKPFLFLFVILFIALLAILFFTPDDDCRLVPT
ncbi:hypothetical protein MtrunA17_Chr2g0294281 [Medicago truncatula]|uniref:Transmembrane protein, putative n=1 Tax=Medicago truncatula TaxID=3880 RepID=G7IMT0_MEDTR|nr:uncharacterized protein LOC11412963 [Medicago truncatula]AES64971.1 transmembrane protein, putative [Medicago truncatula]RHN73046.1 hypothetical protein MtrunA17_Chr2g0294281 [Medicago truncatula]